jgi:hypothetical protein
MVISNQNQKPPKYLSLADICNAKDYACHRLEIPNEDEFLSTEKFGSTELVLQKTQNQWQD